MKWSSYQSNIFDFVENQSENAVVEAVAGSGKTTTLLAAMKLLKTKDAAFMAFNASIANELKEKVPFGYYASTLHSYGMQAIRNHTPHVKVNKNLVSGALWKMVHNKDDQKHIYDIADAISMLKYNLVINPTGEDFFQALQQQGLPENKASRFALFCNVIWNSTYGMEEIDFDDMIYYPMAENLSMRKFDVVFIDECQDLNRAQISMVLGAARYRTICAGDTFQSIYAFRGADSAAMNRLRGALNAKDLPLSITYRCPKVVVEKLKEFVPQVEPAERALKGQILSCNESTAIKNLGVGDMVICRTNAPLLEFAFKCLAAGKPVKLNSQKGLGNSLNVIINAAIKAGKIEIEAFKKFAFEFCGEKIKEFEALGQKAKIIPWEDKIYIVDLISSSVNNVYEFKEKIDYLLSQNRGALLTTVHGAKGLEVPTFMQVVFILKPDLLPHPKAITEDELQQERNLEYVAYSRSKGRLVFIED